MCPDAGAPVADVTATDAMVADAPADAAVARCVFAYECERSADCTAGRTCVNARCR